MKPKMNIDIEKDTSGYSMIRRAGSILSAHGCKEEAKEIHKKAREMCYDDFLVFGLLKEYMDI